MARPTLFADEPVAIIIAAVATGKSLTLAAADARISVRTLRRWLRTKPELQRAIDEVSERRRVVGREALQRQYGLASTMPVTLSA